MNVSVCARVRPVESGFEKFNFSASSDSLSISIDAKRKEVKAFSFDKTFDEYATQAEVFDFCKDTISQCFNGINVTIFAYGQTSTGKTFTIGADNNSSTIKGHLGLIPRVCEYVLLKMKEQPISLTAHVSLIEIYQERVQDLLSRNTPLSIREDKQGKLMVENCSNTRIDNVKDVFRILEQGGSSRAKGETNISAHSSRSHAIFTIYLKQNNNEISKIHLIDLAGSERTKKSGTEGLRFKESVKINSSLLALGNVINSLSNSDTEKHIPYRDSKLTRILQDSLGGNSQTIMIACISPLKKDLDETMNTLRYAVRARKIENHIVPNQIILEAEQSDEDEKLDVLIAAIQKKSKSLKETKKLLAETMAENERLKGQLLLKPPQQDLFHSRNVSEKDILNDMFCEISTKTDSFVLAKPETSSCSTQTVLDDRQALYKEYPFLDEDLDLFSIVKKVVEKSSDKMAERQIVHYKKLVIDLKSKLRQVMEINSRLAVLVKDKTGQPILTN